MVSQRHSRKMSSHPRSQACYRPIKSWPDDTASHLGRREAGGGRRGRSYGCKTDKTMIWMRSRAEGKTTLMLSTPFFGGGRGLLSRQRPLLSPPPPSSASSHLPDSSRILPSAPPSHVPPFHPSALYLSPLTPSARTLASRHVFPGRPPTPTLSRLPSSPLYFQSHVRSCHVNPPPTCPVFLYFLFSTPPLYFLTDRVCLNGRTC